MGQDGLGRHVEVAHGEVVEGAGESFHDCDAQLGVPVARTASAHGDWESVVGGAGEHEATKEWRNRVHLDQARYCCQFGSAGDVPDR